ncbi:MAG: zeta toxin family protein [Burkholderiaceae bacterium]|nr:zeta toxin family protein [Burkholderiaceae bacterium]MCD8516964.1 zeta toxin family protein [Burkholderiaceae bacterium]MCD8536797.1 zeta toxin family protein [Burkholderiaceae bacterium]MCD8565673.1 zeta toxin family protein [Burkholderiaceae bacterium]
MAIPRLRVFAGPNGSGKSTLKGLLSSEWYGTYVNADDIERTIRLEGSLRLSDFKVQVTQQQLTRFFLESSLLGTHGLSEDAREITVDAGYLSFGDLQINSYFASVLADLIRQQLISRGESLTFETVMSSPDKVDFICNAQRLGYRTYLYYVATEDPTINIARVKYRVGKGGHDVPSEKIVSRYQRSLDLLYSAVACTNRAFIFDNSDQSAVWVAEVTDGTVLEAKVDSLPAWCKHALWDKFPA